MFGTHGMLIQATTRKVSYSDDLTEKCFNEELRRYFDDQVSYSSLDRDDR